ncbi:E3 ubiquitin-protein ligase RNF25 isoform X2 [Morus notabilis]|uniref:E3 ubiquitin-protein ligase RNF25 isoform X2 n=1 Tax=Morus notabilis TaxID=981085 RepID=UPI000CECE765|nr:E3 ubiquitin-protein ligase RNF25 isoform X2 [Morus notabilis]
MAAKEEEVAAELEAVQAVYGDDCVVLDSYPPHLHLHINPRTADVTSQQFVEAVISIRAGSKYPNESPQINLIESKGLDEERQKFLVTYIRDKGSELYSCLMLVALCEEAVERLSLMNHPDGDCPLCLYSLVSEDDQNKNLPFMKLMSCFHCFHCECISRWWNWLQTEKKTNPSGSSSSTMHPARDNDFKEEENMGNCPVCRKVFHTKDFEHVLDLVGSLPSQLSSDANEVEESKNLVYSDSENIRRQRFEATLKLQQEIRGLIEPRRDVRISPGMYLPQPTTTPADVETKESNEQQQRDLPSASEMHASSSQRRNTSEHRNPGLWRKKRMHNPRKPVKQWIRKENMSAE